MKRRVASKNSPQVDRQAIATGEPRDTDPSPLRQTLETLLQRRATDDVEHDIDPPSSGQAQDDLAEVIGDVIDRMIDTKRLQS